MRRFMSLSKTRKSVIINSEKASVTDSVEDSTASSAIEGPLPSANLKVKRVDHFYSSWSKKWKYQNSGSNAIPELRSSLSEGNDDPWQQYCFVVVREIPREVDGKETQEPSFKIVVKSPYLLKACKDVIADVPGLSWNAIPLELDPQLVLAFLPHFQAYRDELKAREHVSEGEGYVISSVDVLIDYLHKDYRATVSAIKNLTSHGEITFDLLYAVMLPRSVLVTTCPVTGETQALQVVSGNKIRTPSGYLWNITCEGVDANDADAPNTRGFGRVQKRIILPFFRGTVKITSLDAYPIQYHSREAELKLSLIARGRKWAGFAAGDGIHHMHYKGTGAFNCPEGKIIKYNLNSRVMIDRANFRRLNPNYAFPMHKADVDVPKPDDAVTAARRRLRELRHARSSNRKAIEVPIQVPYKPKQDNLDLTEDEPLLASPVLLGFSLSDKLWLELNVELVTPIEWDEDAFSNLVLPSDRKSLLQSLVEAHNAELGFDDFIKGKGRGLVVNLFGPPGVGKTLSAEATSEHVKRPLYVVGAGDLGTDASELDKRLQRAFELATSWKAIVLIDEADIFLEQRSLHDLERNAMVAVFLRHLEYYPAILFLTTNRIKTYDDAFLSRIHIALHFHALSTAAKAQVWTAFLAKAGINIGSGGISQEELTKLAEREINGRQVKNATRTAKSLAVSRREALQYKHLTEVLDVMDQFSTEFESMRN